MAKFDFAAAIEQSKASCKQTAIEAILLGPSGAGKSYALGTFGCPTLYIYSTGETHGPKAAQKAAKTSGSIIYPICMDLDDGEALQGDAVLKRLLEILDCDELLDSLKIGAIVIDGAAELENYIRSSKTWWQMCLTGKDKDVHNTYAEPDATCTLFRQVLNRLKEVQRKRNVHFAMTCMLDVRDYGDYKEVADASPRLKGYQVAEMLIQQFGDVLVIGPMERNEERKYKFQFMTDLTKVSKDKTGIVKRAVNFNPRLSGVDVPAYLDADFRTVIAHKEKA